MVKLGREIIQVLVYEYGPCEFLRRIADPVWFQSLGTALAFDWNASGLTTVLTAALRESVRGQEKDLGIFICGGKGKTSRKTPEQISKWGEYLSLPEPSIKNLVYNSRMSAKVDSALIQDGYQIYHHAFFFTKNGAWAVVQQGMNAADQTARRYHWFSEDIKDLVCEPHSGIVTDRKQILVLNLSARKSEDTRSLSVKLVSSSYRSFKKDIEIIRKYSSKLSRMIAMRRGNEHLTLLELGDIEFYEHPVVLENFFESPYLRKMLAKLCSEHPENYEKLLATRGVGPKTIRALALVAEVLYGAEPSYKDPARYSFTHGGKDGTPFPVNRKTYDETIETLKELVRKSRISVVEKDKLLKRLSVKS